jgi:ankyrin repeat protein
MNKTKISGTLKGSTALIIASQKGHVDIVKALLTAGADLNKEALFGGVYYTALGFAKREDYPEIVKLLIESGAEK